VDYSTILTSGLVLHIPTSDRLGASREIIARRVTILP
jgi:hypothetical protein